MNKVKYNKYSFYIDKKEVFFNNLDKVFHLATVDHNSGTLKEYYGLNVGISLKHKNQKDADKYYKALYEKTSFLKDGALTLYLYGKNKDREIIVPVVVGEGNGYEKTMGTSCLFGYISPEILAADPRPVFKFFGSVSTLDLK